MSKKIAKKYHERPGGHARELQQRQNRAFGVAMSCATRKKGGNTKFPTLSHPYTTLAMTHSFGGQLTTGTLADGDGCDSRWERNVNNAFHVSLNT
jgi:hypothetical protein